MKKGILALIVASSVLFATEVKTEAAQKPQASDNQAISSGYVVPNAPVIAETTNIITLEAVGMGVFPERGISYAHKLAMAKRAAIVDAYRQMGEKMHGVRIEAKETMRDMILSRSEVQTHLRSLVKNANVVETRCESDLCQVRMELKIDGDRFYGLLTGRRM